MTHTQTNEFTRLLENPLQGRIEKPRRVGKTMVIDKGLDPKSLEQLLEAFAPHVDCMKFGFGTAMLYSWKDLTWKTALCKQYNVLSCTGGTLGEIALSQGKFEDYLFVCAKAGFEAVEISDGTLTLHAETRQLAIEEAAKSFLVITEVGKKLSAFPDAMDAAAQIQDDLKNGAEWVVIEGRESGENAGIYGEHGEFRDDVLTSLLNQLPKAVHQRIMWEAPQKSQQMALIAQFGPNVNLGNISTTDILAVESLRRGLRADTFAWTLRKL